MSHTGPLAACDTERSGCPSAARYAELERIHGRYALVTMCIGGGQGIAAVIEGARN